MAKKLQTLENKLGSWTEQASLTRNEPTTDDGDPAPPMRATYPVARSLMVRIADTAARHGMSQHELVGYLLTWALDQVESEAHRLPQSTEQAK